MIRSPECACAIRGMPSPDFAEPNMLSHVEKLRRLRAEIDRGIRSLDAGEGRPLDIEDILRRLNERYGRS